MLIDRYDIYLKYPPRLANDVEHSFVYFYEMFARGKPLTFRQNETIIKEVKSVMAKLKSNNSGKSDQQNSKRPIRDTRWITCDIRSKEHIPALKQQYNDVGDTLDKFVMVIDQGFEIAIKPNDRGSGSVAYLFAPHDNGLPVRHALSANGKDAYYALVSLMYKYFTVLDTDFGSTEDTQSGDFG